MRTYIEKVDVENDNFPKNDGNYEVITKIRTPTFCRFEKENVKSEKYWKENVVAYFKQQNDFTDEILSLSKEMYNDLEVPKYYESFLKNLIEKLTTKLEKENIYIDLSKCSEEDRKSLPQILEKAGQEIYFLAKNTLLSGKLDTYYPYLVFSRSSSNVWGFSHNKPDRTELTYHEFIKLFEGGEGEKKCCDNPDIQWNKVEIYIGDKQGSYKNLNFKFCYNCGETFNEAFD